MIGLFEDVIAEMKAGVYDFTQDGKCTSCGNCCSNLLPLSVKECKRILDYVQRRHIQECINCPPTSAPVLDMTCPFRDSLNKVCTIYEIRPAICRDFQCDKPRKNIQASKKLFQERYGVVDMRATFFPKE